MNDERFKNYTKPAFQPMRPYEEGEDITLVKVGENITPELGDMIAANPQDPTEQWHVPRKFFEDSYMEVTDPTCYVDGIKTT